MRVCSWGAGIGGRERELGQRVQTVEGNTESRGSHRVLEGERVCTAEKGMDDDD